MVPRVVADFVSVEILAGYEIGPLRRVLADDEEGGVDALCLEHRQELRRQRRVGTIVEGNGDAGIIVFDQRHLERCGVRALGAERGQQYRRQPCLNWVVTASR